MSCCNDPKHMRLYRSNAPSGQSAYCIKCGRSHNATQQEIDRILTEGGHD